MKNFALMLGALVLSLTLSIGDAEAAKRLGGGGSTGMQRQSVTPSQNYSQTAPSSPSYQQAAPSRQPTAAPAPAAQPKRSWMGPLAGLAAGIGLAALASHFGFGEELASFMMMALLAMIVIGVISYFMRRKAADATQGMQYAGAGAGYGGAHEAQDFQPSGSTSTTPAAAAAIPAGFDVESFVRNAKVNFIRLQAANDAGNLDDIREFTAPEMFAEIKLAIDERKGAKQETDVVELSAQVLDVTEEGNRYVVSVLFNGQIREDRGPAEPFGESWHMTKPRDGSRGWVLAGIQQVQ